MRYLIGLFLWVFVSGVHAQSASVRHHLSFEDRHNQYVDVEVQLPASGDIVELAMPNWTPGSYLIRDYAAQLERLSVYGPDGEPLPFKKIAKNRWRVESAAAPFITARYAVWAGELGVNTSWVETSYALLNGAGIFLYTDDSRGRMQHVTFDRPADWSRVSVALPPGPGGRGFVAADYDELVDSPILAGNAPEYEFEVDGHAYALVNQGETPLWDGEKAASDAAKVVAAIQAFWGFNPLQRPYLFLNVISTGTGGLEHDHSTVLLATDWQMRYRDDYLRWLSLLSHEFFHAWNVRRLRPQALLTYDYDREVYTRELWIAEGLTSYYDNLLLFRSGAITVEEYFSLLASEIHKYENTPGRAVRSAELASFDAWIKHYKPDANSVNSDISYSRKGALIGFVADTLLRQKSDHQITLDTIVRELYRLYGPEGVRGPGYPAGAFGELVEFAADSGVREQIEMLLSTTADPDVDRALDWYGLRLDRTPGRSAAEAAGRSPPVDFGIVWDSDAPGLIAEAVLQGSSGAEAGILPGDELLAIDDSRVTRDNFNDRMQRLQPGEVVELLLSRHARILRVPATVQHAVPDKYVISIRADISRREKDRLSNWLGKKLRFVRN